MSLTAPTRPELRRLRDQVDGAVVLPGDDGYDVARAVKVPTDARPEAIVRAASVEDVVRTIGLARDTAVTLAVRSGGHSGAGHGTVDGGVVLDVGPMQALDVDAGRRVATAQTGLTAAQYTRVTAELGLATGFGDTGTVGVGGLVTGGGVGLLSRKHGLTVDSLLSAQVVTADGKVLEVDADHHPDLFWAVRGGGGNFGVVTQVSLRLHDVADLVGGMLFLPATAESLAGFMAAAEVAPRELTTILNVMLCPPLPAFPAVLHGRLILMALIAYAGPVEDGVRAVEPLRSLAPPLMDMVGPTAYPDMFPSEEPAEPGPATVMQNFYLDHVDEAIAARTLRRLEHTDGSMRVVQLRVLRGAVSDVAAEETAYAHRSAPVMVTVGSIVEDPARRSERQAWVRATAGELDQGVPGAYVNFLGADQRPQDAYPGETWERLRHLKRAYDPENLFRRNHNIPPAQPGL